MDRLTFGGNIIETGTDSYRVAHSRATKRPYPAPASLDGLAIGLSLTRLTLIPVTIAIAAQAFVAAQLDPRPDRRAVPRWAERLAGLVLVALGLFLAAERVFA